MSELMNDSVFGELKKEDYNYTKKEKVKIFGKEVEVTLDIYCDDVEEGVNDAHREAYRQLKEEVDFSKIEEEILEYYNSICEDYDLDSLDSVLEVGKLVRLDEIFFPEDEDVPTINLMFDCTWDIEAGVGVKIINGEIETVDDQSTAIYD